MSNPKYKTPVYEIKRGTTFSSTLIYTPLKGEPENLNGCVVTTQMMDSSGFRITGIAGASTDGFTCPLVFDPAETKKLALGYGKWDVRITKDELVINTNTFQIEVTESITII